MKRNDNALPLLQAYDKNTSLFWEASRLMMGSSEVMMQRLSAIAGSFDGRSPLPYAEITRMWHEKFAAGLGLYWGLGNMPLAFATALFKNRNNVNAAAALMDHHTDMASAALKPLGRSVRANNRRMKKKR